MEGTTDSWPAVAGRAGRGWRRLVSLPLPALLLAFAGPVIAEPQGEASPVTPALVPADAFARLPLAEGLQLSPDGDRLAMQINRDGRIAIATFDFLTPGARVLTIPFEDSGLRWYRWIDNDWLLLADPLPRLAITRLYLYHVPSSGMRLLNRPAFAMTEADLLFIAADGSHLLLQRQDIDDEWPSVHRVEIPSGEETELVPPTANIVRWIADTDGNVNAAIGTTRRGMQLLLRDEDGAWVAALDITASPGVGDYQVVLPLTGRRPGFVLSNARTGRFGVYAFDPAAGGIGEALFEHPEVDVDGFTLTPDGSGVEAVFYAVDRDKVSWLDARMAEVQSAIDAALPGRSNRITSHDRGRNRFVVFSGVAGALGDYHIYQHEPRSLSLLNRPYDALAGAALAPVEPVRYQSRDGLTIRGYLVLPAGRVARALPLVVLPHGGPFGRDRLEYDPLVQLLANRGYAVLQPNFRGSTGFGKEFLEAGFGQYGSGMIDDMADGARWLVEQGIVDPGRICIAGLSYGGYAAMLAPIREPGLWRCAISWAGMADLDNQLRYWRQVLPRPVFRQAERLVRGPGRGNLRAQSPLRRVRELEAPLLLAHGRQDFIVPFSHAERMSRALSRAGKDFVLLELPDAGHDFLTEDTYARFFSAVDEFLARHNPADLAAARR